MSSLPSQQQILSKLVSKRYSSFDNIPSPYSEQEKTVFKYISAAQKCEKHVEELHIHEHDQERVNRSNNSKKIYEHETYWSFMSMCLLNELLKTPSCLAHNKNFTTRNFAPTQTNTKQLFQDLQQCAHIQVEEHSTPEGTIQYENVPIFNNSSDDENYNILTDYFETLRDPLKQSFPSFYHALKFGVVANPYSRRESPLWLEGDNSSHLDHTQDVPKLRTLMQKLKLEKHVEHVMENYFTIEPLSPGIIVLAYGAAIPYCRKHVLNCLRKGAVSTGNDDEMIEKASLVETIECLKLQPCTKKILPFLDNEKKIQSQQQQK
ncbi:hypothetical protein C9374_012936 [Naegleria lovaniensis]|uniref:Uncharacterized protein n=1 Tax=Naegleria lovaniensis TaxID=51637 RepID=A0AA88KC57_NAELO|nr:uncharacterized protein C9374_012936 [Naegleria lovaniensis]KAG2372993.1 hypothetical protein C9374_012936 [Naegleria lovaniensis]